MNFIAEFGFDVKEGKSIEFQKWLTNNEEKIGAATPSGSEYLGTFVTVQTSEKTSGSCRQYWRLDSYGAQDNFSAAMKEGGTFAQLMEEYTEFIDQSNDCNWSQVLCRRVTDAAIWGE